MSHLDLEKLEQLLVIDKTGKVLRLEDDRVEYKEKLDWSDVESRIQCIKELAGISNKNPDGGYLIYGIKDTNGEIIGCPTVDLAKIDDFLQSYFSPAFKIEAIKHKTDYGDLFVLFAPPYTEIPTVSKSEHNKLKKGIIYWRYNGKTEPINPHDMVSLLHKLRTDAPINKMMAANHEYKKVEIMPKFSYERGGFRAYDTSGRGWVIRFKNKGKTAKAIRVVFYKECNSIPLSENDKSKVIDQNENWKVIGNYRESFPSIPQKNYKFRLYYTDELGTYYYQEYEGAGGAVKDVFVVPIETTDEEMQEFISSQA